MHIAQAILWLQVQRKLPASYFLYEAGYNLQEPLWHVGIIGDLRLQKGYSLSNFFLHTT